jgi:aminoglycoside 2'-N-acetyltransferase I
MEIMSWPEAEVPPALMLQVAALHERVWPSDGRRSLGSKHDPTLQPVSMLVVKSGRVLAALSILSKPIVHCGFQYSASGLSTVVTDPSERRRGYGRWLAQEAREAMQANGVDLAIFTCDPVLARFYQSAGFEVLPGSVLVGGIVADPLPSDLFGLVTIGSFFTPNARARAADFVGARIALYPGEIDRLW